MKTRSQNFEDVMFRAFADPDRIRILNLLRSGELSISDIVYTLDLAQPMASRHLDYLTKAGLTLTSRRGTLKHYRLAKASTKLHGKLIRCLRYLEEVPILIDDAAKLTRTKCADDAE
jgi:ArsR family transcriptional regulator, arsenate/arsenite/antimonite-responsive transcriptional repressor